MKKRIAIILTGILLLTACGHTAGTETGPAAGAAGETPAAAASVESVTEPATEPEPDAPADVAGTETPEASGQEIPLTLEPLAAAPEGEWQAETSFPDRLGRVDDTLAMNSIIGFDGYSGQGKMYVSVAKDVTSFDMYVNNRRVDTKNATGGNVYELDFSDEAKNGRNTVSVCSIEPIDLSDAVTVCIPYPEIREGSPAEEGIRQETLDAISDIVTSDIDHGFTSAQLAVIRNGALVYEKSWGKINSYNPDGTRKTDSPDVTADTMYDLASVTKMFSVNYSLQKLVTEGKIDLDAHITEFLGDRFVEDTLDFAYDTDKISSAVAAPGLKTQKAWKASLTIRDLLRHQGGFPAGPRYCNPYVNAETQEYGPEFSNVLYAGNDATAETREATIEAICKTPLLYEPGTKTLYSDVDYMILGVVVEQVTGTDLDTYLKENFFVPMGLSHITYNPLENGFRPEDCAATELVGNTRDGAVDFPGIRTETIQGEVHDESAYYSMAGVSGHAGLFSNATDLAKLASVMLTGGYGDHRFFSRNVIDTFTSPKIEDAANWGLGWWREGDDQRSWYFGSDSSSDVIGHQGWTGTLVMIDPEDALVVVYLTNKINSPVTDPEENANKFDGNYYTASTLGFVPELISIGMDEDEPVDGQLFSLFAEMAKDSMKLVTAAHSAPEHPASKNVESKLYVLQKMAEQTRDAENLQLAQAISDRWDEYQEDYAHTPERILNGMSTQEKVEQMLVPDVRFWMTGEDEKTGVTELNEELTEALQKHHFGGVILFADNITDTEQTVRLVDSVNAANRAGGDPADLFVAIDQEGGHVTRVATGTRTTGNMALGATGDPELATKAAGIIGGELSALGINVDFAPVVDVNNNPANPIIGVRSFSDDAETVAEFGQAFIQGLHETGTIVSLKHFPGHGDTQTDSHTGLPQINKTYDEIAANELIPFRACVDGGEDGSAPVADMVMTAHIQYPKIEKETYESIKDGKRIYLPATLSKTILTDLLRGDLGFEGVIVTDAMNMVAIAENFDPMDSTRLAICAGADMILMPVKMETSEGIAAMDDYISGIVRMVEEGEISEKQIDASVMRILKLKEKYGLLSGAEKAPAEERIETALKTVGSKTNHDAEWELACRAVTLVKNEGDLLPLAADAKTAVVCGYDVQKTAVEFALDRLKNEGIIEESGKLSVTSLEGLEPDEADALAEQTASGADRLIIISSQYAAADLDPKTEDGRASARADRMIAAVHAAGGKAVVVSSQLPYDTARYGKADGILACYCARGMTKLPGDYSGDTLQYGALIPASVYTIFGGNQPTGTLPVDVPKLDAKKQYTKKVLYPRGWGLTYTDDANEQK